MEDERRILKSLRDIKDLLDRFYPSLTTKFSIKSLLTLVVENTFSEMRIGATDMPLQHEFDYRFSRAIKGRLKRKCFTPFAYFTAPKSYYPHVFTTAYYNDLPKLCPPKAHKLSDVANAKTPGCPSQTSRFLFFSYSLFFDHVLIFFSSLTCDAP